MDVAAAESYPPTRNLTAEPDTDDALVMRAQRGDAAALDSLLHRYRERIYAFALVLLDRRDDAEDVAQETMVRAVRSLSEYRARGRFRAWLFRIARNLCSDRCRETKRRRTTSLEDSAEEPLASEDPTTAVLLATAVRDALTRLPRQYREVIALHYFNDLTPLEIAAVLQRPRPAVRMQLWRARHLLVKELGDWLD